MRWEKNVGIPVKFHAPYLQGPDNCLGLIGGDSVSHSRARSTWWEVQNFCDVGPQGEGPIGKKHTDAATESKIKVNLANEPKRFGICRLSC